MFKKLLGLLLSFLILVIILVAIAPAKTILSFVQAKLPPQFQAIQLQQVEGSIWSPEVAKIIYKQHTVENVALDLEILKLFIGKLATEINIDDPSLKITGRVVADNKDISLSNLKTSIDAKRLNPFMEFPVKGLAGHMKGFVNRAEFNQDGSWKMLKGYGEWKNAKVFYFNKELALGDIKFEISTDDSNNISLQIIENKGVLNLQGTFQLTPAKSYRLDFTTNEKVPGEIGTWIKRLGKLENNRYRVLWKGRIK